MMSKYAELDAAILESIKGGRDTFVSLFRGTTGALANQFAANANTEVDRVIDRRLQAIRKRGLIRFAAMRWHIVEPAREVIGDGPIYVCMSCGYEDDPDCFGTHCPKCEADLEELENGCKANSNDR